MDEKQMMALKCLDELTEYAAKHKLPMRIMDELEDCRKQLASGNVDWNALNLSIESLLNSVEQKTVTQNTQVANNNGEEVSVEMVKEQVEKMAKRCRGDNAASIAGMAERKNVIVRKCCEQLMEISHTRAHLEELKNEDLYIQFFQNCKTKYESDSFEMFRELLQSVGENYNHMLNHLKSMFQSIGGYKNGIGSEKFYYEYEEQRTGIDQRVQGEIQTADIGGGDIISFAQTTKEPVKKIVKKLVRKRKFLAWVPVLIVFCLITIGIVGKVAVNQNEAKQVVADADTGDGDSSLIDAGKEVAIDVGKEIAKKELSKIPLSAIMNWLKTFLISLGAVLILIVMIIVLLYMLYLKILKRWCDHQISKRCGEYLKTELLRFEQTNEFASKLDAAMENAAEEYESQYMNVLNNLFQDSQYHPGNIEQTSETMEFDSLRAGWNRVRNM